MDTINLLCLRDFNEAGITAKAGHILTLAPGVANRLLDSWPACWDRLNEVVEVGTMGVFGVGHALPEFDPSGEAVLDSRLAEIETEAIEAPAKDKMMHAPAKAKLHAKAARHRG